MSTSSSILREYLVSLGFKIDQPGQKKTEEAITSLDKKAINLGKTLLGAATAAQAMVATFAYQMEKLYYTSKRTDSTIASIQALEFAASQIGLKSGQATAGVEAMGRALRMNPALYDILHSLGVKTTGKTNVEIFRDLLDQASKMPFWQGARWLNYFGISDDTLLMWQKFRKEEEEAERISREAYKNAGVDQEKAGQAGVEYMREVRELWLQITVLKDAFSLAMIDTFKGLVGVTKEVLKDWTKILVQLNNTDSLFMKIAEGMGLVVPDRVELSEEARKRLGQKGNLDKAMTYQGLKTKEGWSIIGEHLADWARGLIPDSWRSAEGLARRQRELARDRAAEVDGSPIRYGTPGAAPKSSPTASGPRWLRNLNPGNLNFANQPGAVLEDGPGARFAKFETFDAGFQALVRQIGLYQLRGIDSIQKLVARYAPASDKNDEGEYRAVLQKLTGLGPNDFLDLKNPAVVGKVLEGILAKETGGGALLGQAMNGAFDRKPVINQTNNITVHGGTATETAKRVSDAIAIQNADIVRKLAARVQ